MGKGKRQERRLAAKQKRVETRQAAKTERRAMGGGVDADAALKTAGGIAGAIAEKGLVGTLLGGASKPEDDDDDDADELGAAMEAAHAAEAAEDDDAPKLTEEPVEWVKANPVKAGAAALGGIALGKLLRIW